MRAAHNAPLHVSGLAAPWNVYNSYQELLKPGAFTAFLAKQKGKPLPMGFEHRAPVGVWQEIKETPEGLWVRGVVEDEYAQMMVMERMTPELSISYRMPPDDYRESITRFNSRPVWQRANARKHGVHLLDRLKVERASLTEISLVTSGAFPGTTLYLD